MNKVLRKSPQHRSPAELECGCRFIVPSSWREALELLRRFAFVFGRLRGSSRFELQQRRVFRFNEHIGQVIDTFVNPTNNGGLDLPHGLAFGVDGNLLVTSANNDSVLRYNGTNGAFLNAFITNGVGGLNYPVWLEFRRGSLFVSSQINHRVLRYDATNGAFLSTFVSEGTVSGPSGMTFGPDGHLYVVGRFGSHVMRYDGTNGNFIDAFVPAGVGGLSQPFGCHFGPDGNFYVVSGNSNKVVRFNGTNGTYLGDFVMTGVGNLSLPVGLEFGPDTNLYVASISNNRVVRFNGLTGALIGDFVSGVPNLSGPNFMLFHDFGPSHIDSITRVGTNVVLSWTGRSDTQMQSTLSLTQTSWQNMTGTLGRNSATNAISTNTMFFRLVRD